MTPIAEDTPNHASASGRHNSSRRRPTMSRAGSVQRMKRQMEIVKARNAAAAAEAARAGDASSDSSTSDDDDTRAFEDAHWFFAQQGGGGGGGDDTRQPQYSPTRRVRYTRPILRRISSAGAALRAPPGPPSARGAAAAERGLSTLLRSRRQSAPNAMLLRGWNFDSQINVGRPAWGRYKSNIKL